MAATCKVPTQLAFILLFLSYFIVYSAKISNFKRCASRDCEETISKAQALANHNSNDPMFLAFRRGDVIFIKSKSAGNRPDLWSGEVNGRRGYFPYAFVREFEVFHRRLDYEEETEQHITPGELALKKANDKADHVDSGKSEDKNSEEQVANDGTVPDDSAEMAEETSEEKIEAEPVVEEVFNDEPATMEKDDTVVNMNINDDETEVAEEPDDSAPQNNADPSSIEVPLPALKEITELDETEVDETETREPLSATEPNPLGKIDLGKETSQTRQTAKVKDETEIDETEITEGEKSEEDNSWSFSKNEQVESNKRQLKDNIDEGLDIIDEAFFHLDDVSSHHTGQESAEDLNKYLKSTFSGGSEEKPDVEKTVEGESQEVKDQESSENVHDVKPEVKGKSEENKAEIPRKVEEKKPELVDTLESKKPKTQSHENIKQKKGIADDGDERDYFDERYEDDEDSTEIFEEDEEDEYLRENFKLDKSRNLAQKPSLNDDRNVINMKQDSLNDKKIEPPSPPNNPKSSPQQSDRKSNQQTNQQKQLSEPPTQQQPPQQQQINEASNQQQQQLNQESGPEKNQQSNIPNSQQRQMNQPPPQQQQMNQPPPQQQQMNQPPPQQHQQQQMNQPPQQQQMNQPPPKQQQINQPPPQQPQMDQPPPQQQQSVQQPPQQQQSNQQEQQLNEPPQQQQQVQPPQRQDVKLEPSKAPVDPILNVAHTFVDVETPSAQEGIPAETNTVLTDSQLNPTSTLSVPTDAVVTPPNTANQEPVISATPAEVQQQTKESGTSQIVIDGTTIDLNDDYDNTLLYSTDSYTSNEFQTQETSTIKSEELVQPSLIVEVVPTASTETPSSENVEVPTETETSNIQLNENSEKIEEEVSNATKQNEEPISSPLEPEIVSSVYQSEDYLSRKPLAVDNGQQTESIQQATERDEPANSNIQEQEANTNVRQEDLQFVNDEGTPPEEQRSADVKIEEPEQSEPPQTEEPSAEATTTDIPPVEGELVPPPVEEEPQPSEADDITERVLSYEDFPPPSDDRDSFADVPPNQEPPETLSDFDPYKTEPLSNRKITDEKLEEEEARGTPRKRSGFIHRMTSQIITLLPTSVQNILEMEPLGLSPGLTVIMVLSTGVILLISTCCGIGGGGGGKKTQKAVAIISKLENDLFILTKEKEELEDSLSDAKVEIVKYEKQLTSHQSKSGGYKTDLQNLQLHNDALKQQVNSLQKQIDEYESEVKEVRGSATGKDKKVKDLEKQIHKLEDRAKKAEKALEKKAKEVEESKEEVTTKSSQMKSLSDQVQQLETRKQQLLSEASDWKEKVDDLNERLNQTEEEYKQMQESVAFKDREFEVLRECFVQLKAFETEKEMEEEPSDDNTSVQNKLQTMIDVAKVNATLRAVEEDRDTLSNKLQIETEARQELEDQLDKVRRDVESFQADKMKAERQYQESQTKLNVLSNYFKEKEMQLQKELGEQEVLKKQNINKLNSVDEKSRQIEEERAMYKQQVESLKRELEAADRDFRAQIAANEQKAHENWLAARAAERELKESRHQNTTLRQRLTDITRKPGPEGLIRPLPTRGVPPPGMMNGPPMHLPPGMDRPPVERSPSRGSAPPPHHPPPREFGDRLPPSDRRLPPGVRMPHPLDARSPPPFDRRPPPPHLDRRTPPYRPPHPDMMPPFRGPPPPRDGQVSPLPVGPPPYDPRMGPRTASPYMRPPPPPHSKDKSPRQQSQV